MKKIPLIIDCDPGVDDALAIILANSIEGIDIKAITTVSGNARIEYTTRNALLIAELLDLDCIIAKGAEEPLVKPLLAGTNIHGHDGLGGCVKLFPNEIRKKLSKENAVTVMRDILIE